MKLRKHATKPLRKQRYDPTDDPSLSDPARLARDMVRMSRRPPTTQDKVFMMLMWRSLSNDELHEILVDSARYAARVERELARRARHGRYR